MRGRFPQAPPGPVGPLMPTPGPTCAPSAGGREDRVFAAERTPPPCEHGLSCAPSSPGASALGAPVRNTSRDASFCRRSRRPGRTQCPEPPPAQQPARRGEGTEVGGGEPDGRADQPSLGPGLWSCLEKPPESLSAPRPAPGPRADPGLGRLEAPGDHRQGSALRHLQAAWLPAPARSRQEGEGGDPQPPKPTPGPRKPLPARKAPVKPHSSCRQPSQRLVPRGSFPRSFSGEAGQTERATQAVLRTALQSGGFRGKAC